MNEMATIINGLNLLKQQSFALNSLVSKLKHNDKYVNQHIYVLQKNAPKLIDVLHLLDRNTQVLLNEIRSSQLRGQKQEIQVKPKRKIHNAI